MQNFIGNRNIGSVRHEQEIQLGQILSKKVGTIDYDFPGAAYYVGRRLNAKGVGTEIGIVPKHTIYFRQSVSPYKYQPLLLLKVLSSTVDGGYSDTIVFEHSDAKALGYGETPISGTHNLMLWDCSASKFSDFMSDAVTIRNGAVVVHAALTNTAASDIILVGSGAADMQNWVIFDETIDLRSDAKPVAVAGDVIASLIYDGRVNSAAITQWRDMPDSMKSAFRQKCGRLFVDTV